MVFFACFASLRESVVLRPVDIPARTILRVVDLSSLLPRQLAPIGLPIRRNPLINSLFPILQMRRLSRVQAAAADALRNPVLLILAPLPDLVVGVVSGIGIVLVVMDFLAEPVLLTVDLLLLLLRQLSPVGLPFVANLAVQIRLLSFHILRLSSRKLTGLDTVRNPVLLIFPALIDSRVVRLRHRHSRQKNSSHHCVIEFHGNNCLLPAKQVRPRQVAKPQ